MRVTFREMRARHLHFDEIGSTMDAARREAKIGHFLLITAESQTRGRGTRGRPWKSPKGNIYFTIAVPRRLLPAARLSLYPLEMGIVLRKTAASFLPPANRENLKLKWPNDLLWEGRKAAGTLMESTADHLFVGIGINVREAPSITDGGTPSACLVEGGAAADCGLALAKSFFADLQSRLASPALENLPTEWKAKALWNKHFHLRDRADRPRIFPVDVNSEGHLRVRFDDGREEWLVSEYLA